MSFTDNETETKHIAEVSDAVKFVAIVVFVLFASIGSAIGCISFFIARLWV